jgi:hypothetical protein
VTSSRVTWLSFNNGRDLTTRNVTARRTTTDGVEYSMASTPRISELAPGERTITITNEPGGDGMSDRTFERTVTVGRYTGGCTELAGHHRLYRVVGVATGDVLNVRGTPSVNGTKVGELAPGGFAWVSGQRRAQNGWQPVTVIMFEGGEQGTSSEISGWANGKFLTALGS